MPLVSFADPYDTNPARLRQEARDDMSEFSKGFGAGVDQTQALAGGLYAWAGSVVNSDEMVRDGMDFYQRQMAEAAQYAPDTAMVDALDSTDDFWNFVTYTAGNVLPSLITMVGTGGVGGLVGKKLIKEAVEDQAEAYIKSTASKRLLSERLGQGAKKFAELAVGKTPFQKGAAAGTFAGGTALATGESFTRIFEELGTEDPAVAAAAGLLSGALDTFAAPIRLLKRMGSDKSRVDELREFIGDDISKRPNAFKAVLREARDSAGTEGLVEAMQEFIQRSALIWADSALPEDEQQIFADSLLSNEAQLAYLHSAISGVVGGVMMGGPGGLIQNRGDKQALDQIEEQARKLPEQQLEDQAKAQKVGVEANDNHNKPEEVVVDPTEETPQAEAAIEPEPVSAPERMFEMSSLSAGMQMRVQSNRDPQVEPLMAGDMAVATESEIQNAVSGLTGMEREKASLQLQSIVPVNQAELVEKGYKRRMPWQPAINVDAQGNTAANQKDKEQRVIGHPLGFAAMDAATPADTAAVVPGVDGSAIELAPLIPGIPEESVTQPVVTNYLSSLLDAVDQGLPEQWLSMVNGTYVLDSESAPAEAVAALIPQSGTIAIQPQHFADAVDEAGLRWAVTHEIMHAADNANGYTNQLPGLSLRIDEDSIDVEMGDIMSEVFDQWEAGTTLGKVFAYPLNSLLAEVEAERAAGGTGQASVDVAKREVFAQLGTLMISDPDLVKENAPLAHALLTEIRENPTATTREIFDGQTDAETGGPSSQPREVRGDLRPPPLPGGAEVQDGRGAGVDGEVSPRVEPADTELARPREDEDGVDPGQFDAINAAVFDAVAEGATSLENVVERVGEVENEDQAQAALDSLIASGRVSRSFDDGASRYSAIGVAEPVAEVAAEPAAEEVFSPRVSMPDDENPKVKKGENFSYDGAWELHFADGDVRSIFYDRQYQWWYDAETNEELAGGYNKVEAIASIVSMRKSEYGVFGSKPSDPQFIKADRPDSARVSAYRQFPNAPHLREQMIADLKKAGIANETYDDANRGDLPPPLRRLWTALDREGFLGFDYVGDLIDAFFEEDIDLWDPTPALKAEIGRYINSYGAANPALTERQLNDPILYITAEREYLFRRSSGNVRGRPALTRIIHPGNATAQLEALQELRDRHPDPLASQRDWLRFERDLSGSNQTLRPPYKLIEQTADIDEWATTHSALTEEQRAAADEGMAMAAELGDLYISGEAGPEATAKLLLWGSLSRMLTASSQEAAFVDLLTSGGNRSVVDEAIDGALNGDFGTEDVARWRSAVGDAIPEGSFGRSGVSNANDFGKMMQKLSEQDDEGISVLERIHNLIADRSVPSSEARRQFQGLTRSIGIDNKVFSFIMMMTGRSDVLVLDRIQLNHMYDAGRYGKLIYDDIAMEFDALHGLARYEALETSMQRRIVELYAKLGRPEDASLARYHWESWVLQSGQVVAHPTMKGLIEEIRGSSSPYAFLGAPEGRQNRFAYGTTYARDADGTPYFLYPDSEGQVYRFDRNGFDALLSEMKAKRKDGITPPGFKVTDYKEGVPWYEGEGINREKLDAAIRANATREATENEYAVEEAVSTESADSTGFAEAEVEVEAPQFIKANDPDDAGLNAAEHLAQDIEAQKIISAPKLRQFFDRYRSWRVIEEHLAKKMGLEKLPAEISFWYRENLSHSRIQNQTDELAKGPVQDVVDSLNRENLTIEDLDAFLLAMHAPERNVVVAANERERKAQRIAAIEKKIEDLNRSLEEAADETATKALGTRIENQEARLEAEENAPLRFQETGSGVTTAEANARVEAFKEEGKHEGLERTAKIVWNMLAKMRENMVNQGLLDERGRAGWESTYQYYVPLKGFADQDGSEISAATSQGFNISGRESRKLRGRTTEAASPFLRSIMDAEGKIIRGERNSVAQRLLALMEQNQDESAWNVWHTGFMPVDEGANTKSESEMRSERHPRDPDTARYIEIKRDGLSHWIEVKDEELNRSLQEASPALLNSSLEVFGKVMTGLSKFQNFRRNMLINWNPSWGLINPLRDAQTALVYALSETEVFGGRLQGTDGIVSKIMTGAWDAGRGFMAYQRHVERNRQARREGKEEEAIPESKREMFRWAKEFIEDGAQTGMATFRDLEEQRGRIESMLKDVGESKTAKARRAAKWVVDGVELYNQATENSFRLSSYIEARKQGVPRLDAATLAKDISTNFNRKGEYSSLINIGYMFFNAALQGNVNLFNAVMRKGAEGKTGNAGKVYAARKVVMGLVGLGFGQTMLNLMLSDDDEDGEPIYKDIRPHVLNHNYVVMADGKNAIGIPMPYGYGWFHTLGRVLAEQITGTRTAAEGAAALVGTGMRHFAPVELHTTSENAPAIQSAGEAIMGLLPDILEFGGEQIANLNFFGAPITRENPYVDEPASSTGKRGTFEAFKAISKLANAAGGGTQYEDSWADFSPDRIQHIFDWVFGGAGRFAVDAFDTAAKVTEPTADEARFSDTPILRKFIFEPSEYVDQTTYYANRRDLRMAERGWKKGTPEERRKLLRRQSQRYYTEMPLQMRQADKALKARRDAIRTLQDSPNTEANRNRIKKLRQEMESIYDRFNVRYRTAAK